ncbi:MAG: ATP-binding protein [Bacteroidota bacterium]
MLKSSATVVLLFFFCLFTSLTGQDYVYSTHDITAADGLLNKRISFIYQDEDGFIWFRSLDGVGRYDGHSIRWFTKSNTKLRGIPRPNLLVEDAEGYFWFTDGNHIDLMHRKTFEVLSLAEKFPNGVPFDHPMEQLWQGVDGGIYMKTINTQEFYHYHPNTGFTSLPHLQGAGSVLAKKKGLWAHFGGKIGWVKFDYENRGILKRFNTAATAYLIEGYKTAEDWFVECNFDEGVMRILKVLENSTEEMMRIQIPLGVNTSSPKFVLYNAVDDQLYLNVSTGESNLSLIDLENRQLLPVTNVKDKNQDTYKTTLLIDKQGVYWQQTEEGLRLVKIFKPVFSQYANGYPTRGLWADDHRLFIQFRYVDLDRSTEVNQIPELERLQSTLHTTKDQLWLGGSLGIYQVNPTTLDVLEHIPKLSTKGLWSIWRDQDKNWWGGLYQDGIVLKTKRDSILRPYDQYNGFQQLKTSRVLQLLEDGPFLWAITNSGLYFIHKDRGVLRRYWSEGEAGYRLPFEDIHYLHKDKDGLFWVASNADGLVHFELDQEGKVKQHRKYTTDDNLSSNILYTILEDDKERLWISTLNGISCFDKKTADIQVFSKEDGLTELEFNRISCFQDKNGRMYFGSIDGVVGFTPDDVKEDGAYTFPVCITSLSVFDGESERLIERNTNQTDEIILQPDDRFFRLSVSMLDFFNVGRLRYAYQIEGLYDDFQQINGNTIEISGLPFGEYKLRVRGQSSDRRYSTQDLVLPLIVVSPIYYRWWFILLVFVLLVATIVRLYYWRIEQLTERRRQLELIVQERTNQIQRDKSIIEGQAARLQELDQVKSRFFANISHELRTPLTLILAPLEGILKRNLQNKRDYTSLQLMQQNGQRLFKRINELLDLSRLDTNKLDVNETPTFLYALVKTTLAMFESTANLKSIQLLLDYELDEQLQLKLDSDKVEKIISNYLSNALKFTPQDGKITLRAERKANQILLSVNDTGIGISSDDLDRVFDRFYQTNQTDQQVGAGIGLALCKELAKVLNGEVWATSQLGQGSTFFLQLPFIATSANISFDQYMPSTTAVAVLPDEQPFTTVNHDDDRPQIMVVEDNADLRRYIALLLTDKYQVITVENGQAAIEQLKTNGPPALIISDLMMPIMDGMELAKHVKANEDWWSTPIVILTARQSSDVKLDALRIGVDDYLTKPFREEELLVRISNLIQNRRNRGLITEEETVDDTPTVDISPTDLNWLEQLEAVISDQLANPKFKLVEAASSMNMSYRRLQQKLKAITGLTPKQYQRSIKLAKARELLKSGQVQTVTEVMYQLGFDNHHYFSKLYREEFGVMPSEEL